MLNKIIIILIVGIGTLTYSCVGKYKNKNTDESKLEKSVEKRFLKVMLPSSKIRFTPDLEGAVLERSKEDLILEYLNDSTNFTSTVSIGGKKIESRWYKVKSSQGNEGWISAICVRFLTEEENRQLISLNEDEVLNDKKNTKNRTQKEAKIDSLQLRNFQNRLATLNPADKTTFANAVKLYELFFLEKASATADIAFANILDLHEKVFKIQQTKVNVAAFQHLAEEIKNYGSANLDFNGTGKELIDNYLTFGLDKKSRVYLKQNYDQLMRKFLRLITPSMQNYLEQCASESDNPAIENNQLIIPLTEIAAHAVFWDKYLSRFPYSPTKLNAKEKRIFYSSILLEGYAGKTAFSEGKLNATFKESYKAMTSKMGVSPLIKSFKEYYTLLESEKFKETKKTKAFVEKILSGL